MKSDRKKENTPRSKTSAFFADLGTGDGVNCQVFFEITHVRGVGRWQLVLQD